MKRDDFTFDLPAEAIAQHPPARREDARLLVLGREDGAVEHTSVADVGRHLRPGDLLVFNDTRVIPARLDATKPSGGRVEVLLVEPVADARTWRCRMRASRRPRPGSTLSLADGTPVEVLADDPDGPRVRFPEVPGGVHGLLERLGALPLPPYIRRGDGEAPEDRERYQTVFARRPGAIAAPTAGLHFSEALLAGLRADGIETTEITLHVGPGTFEPVRVEDVDEHRMHAERFAIPERAAIAIERARAGGGRVVAVGTTVVRTLESRVDGRGRVEPGEGRSALFIRPGFRFRAVDALLTNFHLPSSTLLMLVAAFAGRERVLAAYREAIDRGYRFYSYGDAMLIR